ncbi:hypothetical protein BJY01DRAFT_204109 [Aspergillus pseudoustus]|uniref:Uncharacterized protein n=1 Tax=Aspergillus pseudoustus TaxID=1810923 RepID=A0ABR4KSZ4_9EURO
MPIIHVHPHNYPIASFFSQLFLPTLASLPFLPSSFSTCISIALLSSASAYPSQPSPRRFRGLKTMTHFLSPRLHSTFSFSLTQVSSIPFQLVRRSSLLSPHSSRAVRIPSLLPRLPTSLRA